MSSALREDVQAPCRALPVPNPTSWGNLRQMARVKVGMFFWGDWLRCIRISLRRDPPIVHGDRERESKVVHGARLDFNSEYFREASSFLAVEARYLMSTASCTRTVPEGAIWQTPPRGKLRRTHRLSCGSPTLALSFSLSLSLSLSFRVKEQATLSFPHSHSLTRVGPRMLQHRTVTTAN